MASPDSAGSSLLSKLQSLLTPSGGHGDDIFSLYSDHLRPFSDLSTVPAPNKSSKSADQQRQSLIRSLAKQHLNFLNQSLSLFPKLLSAPRPDQSSLFQSYRLCLRCLDLLSSQLSCKPYAIHKQRLWLVRCLASCGMYNESKDEGVDVLGSLRSIDLGAGRKGKASGKYLPDLKRVGEDKDFIGLVIEILVELLKCLSMAQSKVDDDYVRIVELVEEGMPWFRALDADKYEKWHKVLTSYMGKIAQFLISERKYFDAGSVRSFVLASLAQYLESPLNEQAFKFARRLCSLLLSAPDEMTSLILDIITRISEFGAPDGKFEKEESETELIEMISYCATKCRNTATEVCSTFATNIESTVSKRVRMPFELILGLYAVGLHLSDAKIKSSAPTASGNHEVASIWGFLLVNAHRVNGVSSLLGRLKIYFQPMCKENSLGQICSFTDARSDTRACGEHIKKEASFLLYIDALKFLYEPLAELINIERKQVLAVNEVDAVAPLLSAVQDALNQFIDVLVFNCSSIYQTEKDGFEDNIRLLLSVSVASFTLSFVTKLNIKRIVKSIEDTVESQWLQHQGLKFLLTSLHNIGVSLYRNKQIKEASKALKLSCKASWTCVKLHCRRREQNSQRTGDSGDATIVDFINDTCSRSSFYLDILHQLGSKKVAEVVISTITSWSIAYSTFSMLPAPTPLVKRWVKIQCKEQKSSDAKFFFSLCELLVTSGEVSREALTIISEQELLAYTEMGSFCPDFSNKMKTRITGVLLEEGYLQDNVVQKAKLLIERGIALGARGIANLNECIELLSQVASEKAGGGQLSLAVSEQHQLATAFCLRALCIQEGDPNSKEILQDIAAGLNLWSGLFKPENCSGDKLSKVLSEVSLRLFSNILDLLALKGCFAFHLEIEVWKIILKACKWMNIPQEKCLSYLWQCRRMSHGLCTAPVSNVFVKIVSENFGEQAESMDFWITCFKDSQPLIVGFHNCFSFTSSASPQGCPSTELSLQLDTRVCEVKKAVRELVSSDTSRSFSTFCAGYLLYDLCESLISNGRVNEALLFAKESHRLCTNLFQDRFTYSIERQVESYNEVGEVLQNNKYNIKDLQLSRSVIGEVWTFDSSPFNLEDSYISAWSVLQVYLESTLQVGSIHELVGNVTEAETFFLWGKAISLAQDLAHFTVAFSSALGKLYYNKQWWSLAGTELHSAKQILERSKENSMNITCPRCFSLLEANIDLQLGNLIRSDVGRATRIICSSNLSDAEKLFRSGLDKLCHFQWKNSDFKPMEASEENYANGIYRRTNKSMNKLIARTTCPVVEVNGKIDATKGRRSKNVAKISMEEQHTIYVGDKRVTRSKFRSSKQCVFLSDDGLACPVICEDQTDSIPLLDSSTTEVSCICNNTMCWRCLLIDVERSGLLNNCINLRWELFRRRTSTGLLIGIGKCMRMLDEVHSTHEILLQSIANVFSGRNNELSQSPVNLKSKELSGDMLAIERAAVLYSISWFLLKSYRRQRERKKCCDLSHIKLPQVASWLKQAFILCHEVSILAQKVARLLSITYIFADSSEPFSKPRTALSGNYLASYFHQVSVGSQLSQQFTLHVSQKENVQRNGSTITDLTSIKAETFSFPRLAPETVKDLEDCVRNFFKSLPCTTIVCISVLGSSESFLLQELFPASAHAWMLLSRFNPDDQPLVLLKPLDPILEDAIDDGSLGPKKLSDLACSQKKWRCPWGHTIIDDVIPTYREILGENYRSSSVCPLEYTEEYRHSWWKRRKNLDLRLDKLLRKLEDSWLGPWKFLLLGGLINMSHLETLHKKLMRNLKSKCNLDANESLVRVLLESPKSTFLVESFIAKLHSKRACYIDCTTRLDNERLDEHQSLASQLVGQAMDELGLEDSPPRDPIILVLDSEVQMLPWENFPILRSQEVYRMPSVYSISLTIERSRNRQERLGIVPASFPFIDPLDAFFLLNPGGDLRETQINFENWFRDCKLEGKAGSPPPAEELTRALQQHDLFIYFGHGSGAQYIPQHEVQKLETCAATLLMGCSSGVLSLRGSYAPEGVPLAYLAAGSPAIIANLWEVTDKDIDRFGKAVLEAWLEERSKTAKLCAECGSLADEFSEMDLRDKCTGKKKKLPKKKQASESRDCMHCCNRSRARMGSFMGQAREACMLPFLIGAAPVCYGVPTGIKRKIDL